MNKRESVYALASAALFGISTPAAKVLLGAIDPIMLAGLLYCGAGIGVAALRRWAPALISSANAPQVGLNRKDVPWLGAAIAAGGVAAPLLLMWGLTRTDAATASLLLAFEGAATALLAWFVFHENVDRRILLGMLCLIVGAGILSWSGTPTLQNVLGPLAILGACIAWELDNNLTRRVSLADPLQIVELKGLIAGPFNIALGPWVGATLSASPVFGARRNYRIFWIWRKPRTLRPCTSPFGRRADRCILLVGTIPRRCSLGSGTRRRRHKRPIRSWYAHGIRCLAARH